MKKSVTPVATKKVPASAVLPNEYLKAFKPADIRGIYPTELDEEVAYRIARAFVVLYKLKKVILGRDMRVSSVSLRKAFVKGVTDQGAEVIDIGLVDTPAVYYASGKYKAHGAMITASHNPKQYNGIKLVKPGAVPLTEEDGLGEIKQLLQLNEFSTPKTKGVVTKKAIFAEYKEYIKKLVTIKSTRKIRVVVDAGNGMATVLAPILKNGYPLKMYPLFFKLDGRFPNRGSNPTVKKNIGPIVEKIREVKPDFGVAFDGDVDRVAFFDETGKPVNSAVIGAMIAKNILEKKPGNIVYTNFTSKSFYETILKYGGTPVREKVGHSFIKTAMREVDAPFSCEHSAHFFFKENYYSDSGILAFLRVLEEFASPEHEGKKFSALVKEFNLYQQTEELLIPVRDKDGIIESVRKIYADQNPLRIDLFDGLAVDFPDYWFCLRKSVTEDVLNLVVEARDVSRMKQATNEILDLVKKLNTEA